MSEPQTGPSPNTLLAISVAGIVLCPALGPVAIVLADRQRKQAVIDSVDPHPRVLIARILGYVGTLILCLDVLAVMGLGLWFAVTGGPQ